MGSVHRKPYRWTTRCFKGTSRPRHLSRLSYNQHLLPTSPSVHWPYWQSCGSTTVSVKFQMALESWVCQAAPVHHVRRRPCSDSNLPEKPDLMASADSVSSYGLWP